MESALARLALRLCSVAEGMDEKTDRVLAEIRRLVEAGASEPELDDASSKFLQVLATHAGKEDGDDARLSHLAHDLSGLDVLVTTLPVRADEQERMSTLLHRARSSGGYADRRQALSEFIAMATGALRKVGSRYLDSNNGANGVDGIDAERYLRAVQKMLLRLVEHLDSLHGNALRSHALRERTQHMNQLSQTEPFVQEMTQELAAIDERVLGERQRIAGFLSELRDRLDSSGRELKELYPEPDGAPDEETPMSILIGRLDSLRDEAGELGNELRNKTDVSLKDPLTGVYSRDGFDGRCGELMERWRHTGLAFSLVVVECLELKGIVAERGHAVGDRLLIWLADLLQSRARGGDVVCRYDDEHFVVLLPTTPIAGAESFATSAREAMVMRVFEDRGDELPLTIACGVTGLVVGDTIESVVGRAGEALYEARKEDSSKVVTVA